MKERFFKIIAVSLALMVLFSTVSFSVAKHYCGDMLVDVAIFKDASSCGMEMAKGLSSECSVIQKNCCRNIQIVIQGQDNLKDNSFANQLNTLQVYIPVKHFDTSLHKIEEVTKRENNFREYIPPLLVRDICILDQTFLI